MKPNVIGIAGGSGSGKSTLVTKLTEAVPDQVVLIQQDDYFRGDDKVPKLSGFSNYEHPDAWDVQKMARDIQSLKDGKSVKVFAKNHAKQGAYGESDPRIWVTRNPKPFVVVEGFLVLWYPQVRDQLDLSFYLDAPFDKHIEKVLEPMHHKYVQGSKQNADKVIDVAKSSADQVLSIVVSAMQSKFQ